MKENDLNNKTLGGSKYTEFRKLFTSKKRIYSNLDLNKILMADIEPYLFQKTNSLKFLLDRIYSILISTIKLIVNVYLFEYILFKKSQGSSTWFIISPNIRDSYL